MKRLQKLTRKMLSDNVLDAREAAKLSQAILEDSFVSRGERRFLKQLLRKGVCDSSAEFEISALLQDARTPR